jgi:hypothetical protein
MGLWSKFKAKADAIEGIVNWWKGKVAFAFDHWKLVLPFLIGVPAVAGGTAVATVTVLADPVPNISPGAYGVTTFDEYGGRLSDPRITKLEESGSLILYLEPNSVFNTFLIDAAAFGPPEEGAENVFQIFAEPGSNFYVETFLVYGLRCQELSIQGNELNSVTLSAINADGAAISPTLGRTTPVQVPQTADPGNVESIGSTYDKFAVKAQGNVFIGTMAFTNVAALGGICIIQDVNAGTFTVANSDIGDGSGRANQSFLLHDDNIITNLNTVDIIDDVAVDVRQ